MLVDDYCLSSHFQGFKSNEEEEEAITLMTINTR